MPEIKDRKYDVLIQVDASVPVEVTLAPDATYEAIRDAAMEVVDAPRVCHQCYDEIEVGDLMDVLEIFDASTNSVVRRDNTRCKMWDTGAEGNTDIKDAIILLRRIIWQAKKKGVKLGTIQSASDYLEAHGLLGGSILREVTDEHN